MHVPWCMWRLKDNLWESVPHLPCRSLGSNSGHQGWWQNVLSNLKSPFARYMKAPLYPPSSHGGYGRQLCSGLDQGHWPGCSPKSIFDFCIWTQTSLVVPAPLSPRGVLEHPFKAFIPSSYLQRPFWGKVQCGPVWIHIKAPASTERFKMGGSFKVD